MRNHVNRARSIRRIVVIASIICVALMIMPSIADSNVAAKGKPAHPPRPYNLSWEDIWIVPDNPTGDSVTWVYARLYNLGQTDSNPCTSEFYVDGNLVATGNVPTLGPGEPWEYSYSITLAPGYHELSALVLGGDPNPDDDSISETFWWKGPDLRVTDIWVEDTYGDTITSIACGQYFEVHATVMNDGDAYAPAGVPVYADVGPYSSIVSIDALGIGASTSVTFWGNAYDTYSFLKLPGDQDIEVTVDWLGDVGTVNEANQNTGTGIGTGESNNVRIESLTLVKAKWTVLIYASADDDEGNSIKNLEAIYLDDYQELCAGVDGSNIDISIVMQLDRADGFEDDYGDWTDTKRFLVEHDRHPYPWNSITDRELGGLGELNMGSGAVLEDYLVWGADRFRADNYLVILSGHGAGWDGAITDITPSGSLSPNEISDAFSGMCDEMAANGDGDKIDVVLFRSCLNGAIEIAYEIEPYVDYMVAVETLSMNIVQIWGEPTLKDLPYYRIIGDGSVEYIKNHPEVDPWDLAWRIVEESNPASEFTLTGGGAIAAYDLSELNSLVAYSNNLAILLRMNYIGYKTEIEVALQNTEVIYDTFDLTDSYCARDLYQFAEKVYDAFDGVSDPDVRAYVRAAALNVMDRIVLPDGDPRDPLIINLKRDGAGHCHGISAYVPDPDNCGTVYYISSGRFWDDTIWRNFTHTLHDTEPPEGAFVNVSEDQLHERPDIGLYYVGEQVVNLVLGATDKSGIRDMGWGRTADPGEWSDWMPYSETLVHDLLSGDGEKFIKVRFRDYAGQIAVATFIVYLDTEAPIADFILINGGDPYTSDSEVSLSLSASDNGAGIEYMQFSEDGGPWSDGIAYSDTHIFDLYSIDGERSITLRVRDYSLKYSNTVTDTIFLDENAPIVVLSINNGDETTSSRDVYLTIDATDGDGSGPAEMCFSDTGLDGSWTTWQVYEYGPVPYTLPDTGDGTRTVYVKVRDVVGWETIASDSIVLGEYSGWYGCTIPDGYEYEFYEIDNEYGTGGHIDTYVNWHDHSYDMMGVSVHTYTVGNSGGISVSGWFRMHDTFESYQWEDRRFVRVYALDESATTILAYADALNHTHNIDTWIQVEDLTISGLSPESTISIGVGRRDNWDWDRDLMAEWAGVEVEPVQIYTLTVISPPGGSEPVDGDYTYPADSYSDYFTATLTYDHLATLTRYTFSHWDVDGTLHSYDQTTNVYMDCDHTLEAVYDSVPITSATLTWSDGQDSGVYSYPINTWTGWFVAELSFTRIIGPVCWLYTFTHWDLDGEWYTDDNWAKVWMDTDHTLLARYDRTVY